MVLTTKREKMDIPVGSLGISQKALEDRNALYNSAVKVAGIYADNGLLSEAVNYLEKANEIGEIIFRNVSDKQNRGIITNGYEKVFAKTLELAESLEKGNDMELIGRTMDRLGYLADTFPGNVLRRGALKKKVQNAKEELLTDTRKYLHEANAVSHAVKEKLLA